MRRTLAALTAALAGVTVSAVPAVAGVDPTPVSTPVQQPAGPDADPAAITLSRAARVLDPVGGRAADTELGPGAAARPEVGPPVRDHASEVMRELFQALPELEGEQRTLARRILSRPTDGAADPRGQGYTTASVKSCKPKVCVHWVRSTSDAPPGDAWARKSLAVLNHVYRYEVGQLGFRPPVPDGHHGGNAKLDVYLKDLGAGLYGYCVPEYYKPGSRKVAAGYCVIDNDFSRTQFEGSPLANLKVTLAHEFFHVVQFAYDIADDPWVYESTAVWMEERFADGVDDNRQYLTIGQLRDSHVPLDSFADPGVHYGNWVWWEYLTSRFGDGVVKDVWAHLDANKGGPSMYSTQGLRSVLRTRGGLGKVFAAYAAASNVPGKVYAEGRHWPRARVSGSDVLGSTDRRARFRANVDHLASRNYLVRPERSLRGRWTLRIKVKAPARAGAGAHLVVKRENGSVTRRPVVLDRDGVGRATAPFGTRGSDVSSVIVTVANASTRFRCWKGTTYSCRGVARDDSRRFTVLVSASR